MAKSLQDVSDAELEILKLLWEHGPATVREVSDRFEKRWAYNTVLTLMSRLRDKGYVTSRKAGVAHVFQASVSRERLLRQRLADLAERVCDGTTSPLVHALVKGGRLSAEDVKQLRKLVDELDERTK